jgi:endonuclease
MRVIVGKLSVTYTGRGATELPPAIRMLIIKTDGTVLIHGPTAVKPLNYMPAPTTITTTRSGRRTTFTVTNRAGEQITVRVHSLISDTTYDTELEDKGLVRAGTEKQLQAWLAVNPDVIGANLTLLGREVPTGAGPVDLVYTEPDGTWVVVEVKRVAASDAVRQISSYLTALTAEDPARPVRGVIAATAIRPRTVTLATARGVDLAFIPVDWQER